MFCEMSPEQFSGLLTAIAVLIASLLGVWQQLRKTHELVNSRMTELVDLTRRAALAEGRLSQKESDKPPEP
jgi:hypothetical protein